jgi:hypothetical protein
MTTEAKQSAAEFLVMNAANVLMNQGRVRAVMVIVAFEPKAGSKNATVVMNPCAGRHASTCWRRSRRTARSGARCSSSTGTRRSRRRRTSRSSTCGAAPTSSC